MTIALIWALAGWACAAVFLHRASARAELVARASHELRGPLTAALLAAGDARAVEAQLQRARLALDDLLAAPRGARAADQPEHVSAATLLAQLTLAWQPAVAARGRELRIAPAPAGTYLLADRTRLAQALGNLIANALEHGSGPIDVRSRVLGDSLRLEVRDGGSGLPAPVAEIVAAPRGGRGSRGRGLAIAAGIAERHGGRLTAAPSATGATLVLELPVVVARAAGAEASS